MLTPTQIARLAQAAKSDDAGAHHHARTSSRVGAARPKTTGTLTWKFAAKNVRDVAWAASPEYQWDAIELEGHPRAWRTIGRARVEPWKDAADQSRMSIQEYSERWFQYPWPQISRRRGADQRHGVSDARDGERRATTSTTCTTSSRTRSGTYWFPMIVGSNERVYMWQDEGFNTFINTFSRSAPLSGEGRPDGARGRRARSTSSRRMKANVDGPIDIDPDRIDPRCSASPRT